MSIHNNGPKQFLYVVEHERGGAGGRIVETDRYMIRGDHDPTEEEIVTLLELNYDPMKDIIEAQRYDIDALPTLPPKS